MPADSSTSRPRMTRQQVAAHFRQRIIAGALQPGDRLPSRDVLTQQLAASYVTIQRGIAQLDREGFIVSRHGDGTYVAHDLPHRCHYGVLLTKDPQLVRQDGAARFHHSMLLAAERLNHLPGPQRIHVWYDSTRPIHRDDYHDLVHTLRDHRLAGLIFLDLPLPRYQDTPVMDLPAIGRVTAAPGPAHPGLGHVSLDYQTFLTRAMQMLAARGRRRVAVLTAGMGTPFSQKPFHQVIAETAAQAGLVTKPQWTIPQHPRTPGAVQTVMRLLFDLPRHEWPDALIITDDHMVEDATQGLYHAGVDTTQDLTVIGFCNFPDTPPAALPILRLGLDCRELLTRLTQAIDQQNQQHTTPQVEAISPVTEAEFHARYPA